MNSLKKIVIMLSLSFLSLNTYAQIQDNSYSFIFNDITLENVFTIMEHKCKINFFYQNSWIENFPLINKSYENEKLSFILNDIFETSNLNFFIYKQSSIILTNKTVIYNRLPSNFFHIEKQENNNNSRSVFFKNESNSNYRSFEIGNMRKETSVGSKLPISLNLINKLTKKPFRGIDIVFLKDNVSYKTDESGILKINLEKGIYEVEIKSPYIENEIIELVVNGPGNIVVESNKYIEQLQEVILDASLKKALKDVITKTNFDVEESKNIPLVLGERDLLKVSTTLPGISSAGEGAVGYNVRGGKTDQNLVFLDKAVVYNPQHFFGLFTALNPYAVEDINIYKSAIPSEFGGRLSSVFEIETKRANTNNLRGEASIGPVTGNLMVESPIVKNKSGILIGGRIAYADWILNEIEDASLQNSQASFYDVVAKYNHEISEKTNIQATAYLSNDILSVTRDSLYNYSNKLISLRSESTLNKKQKLNLTLSNSNYSFAIDYDGPTNNDFKINFDANEINFDAKLEYAFRPKLNFIYGISTKLYNINPGNINALNENSDIEDVAISKERALESAVFISSNFNLSEKLNADIGFRFSVFNGLGPSKQFEYASNQPKSGSTIERELSFSNREISKTYGNPELRLAFRYLVNDSFSVKSSYGRMVQYVHTLSNNTTASPIDVWKLSDINITPQTSDQFTLGAFKNFEEGKYQLSLEGFYKLSNNVLDFKTGSQILLNENIEQDILQGEGKAYGIEFLTRKEVGRLNGWFSYTYSRSLIRFKSNFIEEEINDGNFFPSNYDRPHNLNIVANYKFTKRYSVSSNFTYQTGRPVTIPEGTFSFGNSEFTTYSDRNEFRIPDYYRLDIGFNVEGNHKLKKKGHSFWTISVYNILGRNNPFSVFFVTEDGEVKAYQSSVFSIPIPSITYNLKF